MTSSMTPRQRVQTALTQEEPDSVPLALGGGPYGLVDDLYLHLVKHLDLGKPVPPFRTGHSISYMDDRLLDRLGTDLRYCWPGLLPNSPVLRGEDEDTFYDSYGQVWKRALPYYYTGEGILKDAVNIDDIGARVRWPDLSDPRWVQGVAERARLLHDNTDYFVVMRMVASHGPFQTACDLRGTETFLMDLAIRPEFADVLLDQITTAMEGLLKLAMQAGGKYFDMIELPGDDYAGNTNTLISPAMFRKFIRPCLERLIKVIKEHNPNTKVMLHSDGAITKLLPDLIALGVEVIHPLEPLPAMDMPLIKEQFGKQLNFLGGIDISRAMPGTQEDVIAETKLRISQLARGGGYILAPSNHLQADVPAENVVTLFQAARQFGKYPLQIS
ncbi:MAG TPA: uroporphyrinogen decarboxylase family protein [Anaerolineales bacterium]|nr:uroporphyrinogen decarboxylase family protein [Anaerolineales bacterium]